MNRQQKRAIVAEARRLFAQVFPDANPASACLYLSWAVCQVAHQHGHRLLMLAGSAYWPRVTPATDDGGANVFGYEWEPESAATRAALAADRMPEIHVWAGDPSTGEIIDLTVAHWPEQCRKLHGSAWLAPKPPAFWWGPPSKLPPLAIYRADKGAGRVALELLKRTFGAAE